METAEEVILTRVEQEEAMPQEEEVMETAEEVMPTRVKQEVQEEAMPQEEVATAKAEEEMPQAEAEAGPKAAGGRLDRPAVVNTAVDKIFVRDYLVPVATEVRNNWGWRFKDVVKDFKEQAHSEPMAPSSFAVALCVTTYMRTYQIKQMLPINVCCTWKHRANIFWIIADFNMTDDVQEWLLEGPLQHVALCGHAKYFRALEPFSWHASVAKNTSKMAARVLEREGFAFEDIYVVCLDNDNIITPDFLDDIQRTAEQQCTQLRGCEIQGRMDKEVGGSWASGEPGTTGRIGCPLKVFEAMKGYDEDFLPMGCQDICLLKRLGLVGRVRMVHEAWCGFSVPNQEAKTREMMDTMKALEYCPPPTHTTSTTTTTTLLM